MVRFICIALLIFPSIVFGHGGVSMDDDVCIIQLGRYKAHFTAYMPEKRSIEEFCESLPVVGRAVITIDFVSGELRRQKVEFDVIRDFTGKGAKASAADFVSDAGKKSYADALIYQQEASVHQNGTINFPVVFDEKGWYVGIMKVYSEDGEMAESVFPIEVAPSTTWLYFAIIPFILIGVGLLFRIFDEKKE